MHIVILGAGGDAMVIAEAIHHVYKSNSEIVLDGFLDDTLAGQNVCGLPVFGRLDDWVKLNKNIYFIPAIQKVKDMPQRVTRLDNLGIPLSRWGRVVHPRSTIARNVDIGVGVYIAACVTVQPGSTIGNFATLRASAALGHDTVVERHGYMGPNSTLCGKAIIREGGHLGPNAVVLDQKIVGRFAVVGIGSAVTKNIPEFTVVMGNPARRVGYVKDFGIFCKNSSNIIT